MPRGLGLRRRAGRGAGAGVHPSREIVVPLANDKVREGMLEDEAIVTFAVQTLREFVAGL